MIAGSSAAPLGTCTMARVGWPGGLLLLLLLLRAWRAGRAAHRRVATFSIAHASSVHVPRVTTAKTIATGSARAAARVAEGLEASGAGSGVSQPCNHSKPALQPQ